MGSASYAHSPVSEMFPTLYIISVLGTFFVMFGSLFSDSWPNAHKAT